MDKLRDLLKIKKGLTAIIGAGGKTSLIKALARELSDTGKVIIATSTRIYPFDGMPKLINATEKDVRDALEEESCVCVGEPCADMKLAAPSLPFEALAGLVDYVLVEADGSKHKPLKAHRPSEPVIPENADQTILVIGLNAIGMPIRDAAHRPEIFSRICECDVADAATIENIARVANSEKLHDRAFLNQADGDFSQAARLAKLLACPVVAGSLRRGECKCLSL